MGVVKAAWWMNLALGRDFAVIFCSLCRGPAEALHLCQTLHFLDQLPPRPHGAGSPCVRGICHNMAAVRRSI